MAKSKGQTPGGSRRLTIEGDLTVSRIREIHAAIAAALQESEAVDVELTNVAELDVSFLQLLCSAHRTAAEAGKQLTVRGLDREPLSEAQRQAGFPRHIGCRESTRRTCLWLPGAGVARG